MAESQRMTSARSRIALFAVGLLTALCLGSGGCGPSTGEVVSGVGGNGRVGYCTARLDGVVREERIRGLAAVARQHAENKVCKELAERKNWDLLPDGAACSSYDYRESEFCMCLQRVQSRCD